MPPRWICSRLEIKRWTKCQAISGFNRGGEAKMVRMVPAVEHTRKETSGKTQKEMAWQCRWREEILANVRRDRSYEDRDGGGKLWSVHQLIAISTRKMVREMRNIDVAVLLESFLSIKALLAISMHLRIAPWFCSI